MRNGGANAGRVANLDLLRFLAALFVLLYHYISSYLLPLDTSSDWANAVSSFTRYGYLGVDLFFMISGFVIIWSARSKAASDFVISRISRLYPTFWVAVGLTVAAILVLTPLLDEWDGPGITISTVLANLTMMPQLFNVERIDSVYWTLEIEIRFYFLVFLVVLTRQMHRVEWLLYGWLIVALAFAGREPPWFLAYFFLLSYAPLFISGGLFFLVFNSGWTFARAVGVTVSCGLSVVAAMGHRSGFITPDAVSGIVVPFAIAGMHLVFAVLTTTTRTWIRAEISQFLGSLTYPLYLTHATIGLILIRLLTPVVGGLIATILTFFVAFLLAYVLVRTVDGPARVPLARFVAARWQAIAALVRAPKRTRAFLGGSARDE